MPLRLPDRLGDYVAREADAPALASAHQGVGLGHALLAHAEREALRQGFDSIYLHAQEVMTENLALYRSIGYEEYARRVEHGLPRVYLHKRLDHLEPQQPE